MPRSSSEDDDLAEAMAAAENEGMPIPGQKWVLLPVHDEEGTYEELKRSKEE